MKTALVTVVFAVLAMGVSACHNLYTANELLATVNVARAFPFLHGIFGSALGRAVAAAGDVNGDGYDDVLIDAPYATYLPMSYLNAGEVYVVFGRSVQAWATTSPDSFNFNLTDTPDASSWIKIRGVSISQYIGLNSLGHGDFNADGISDILIAASNCGTGFVIYGHTGVWTSFTVTDINTGAVAGFTLIGNGVIPNTFLGSAGDLNGDGIEDILVSEYENSISVPRIIFGQPGPERTDVILSLVDGTNGFALVGEPSLCGFGVFDSPGDVNGDGLADFVIGDNSWASGFGRTYVLFARNASELGQWNATFNVSNLDGSNGFIIQGTSTNSIGYTVVNAGDINNDGFDDVFIGTSAAAAGAWVVFGHAAPWNPLLEITQIDGSNGFHFYGGMLEYWGQSGGTAGDINSDGVDDLIIGGYRATDFAGLSLTGAAVVLFGHSGTWPATIIRTEVVGAVGFQIDGVSLGSGFGLSARGAGDVNGDGITDIIIGADYHNDQAGFATLVFGYNDHCTVCNKSLTDACLVCRDAGFAWNGTACALVPPVVSSSSVSRVTVVVIINFFDEDVTGNENELEQEIADALGIDAGLVSVVVVTPTQVQVTIAGETVSAAEATASQLVNIINNGNAGSGSTAQLLRKAIDAHIRRDEIQSSNDDIDAASQFATCIVTLALALAIVLF